MVEPHDDQYDKERDYSDIADENLASPAAADPAAGTTAARESRPAPAAGAADEVAAALG